MEMKEKGQCVISGFHSQIEKDIFEILLRGTQPLILVLARGMKQRWPVKIKTAIESRRLLVISPFEDRVKYVTQKTANFRNKFIIDLADEVFIAYHTKNGNLSDLLETIGEEIRKKIHIGFSG